MATWKTMTLRVTDETAEKYDYVCKARNMTKSECFRKFVETQYDLYNKDSEVNKILEDMEKLTKSLAEYTEKLNS